MNKVKERSLSESSLRIKFASDRLFRESKYIKLALYFIAIIPIVIALVPSIKEIPNLSFMATIFSFGLTIVSDLLSQFIANHKEIAILERQFYEAEITGSTFSKMEYDRETTNELNELAIRKGIPDLNRSKKRPFSNVPEDISDDYSYLYLIRVDAARNNYLLSRIRYIYIFILAILVVLFTGLALIEQDTIVYLQLIIGFYPLLVPIIRNITSCRKAADYCIKISADIDNFFADGDTSLERLARFYYYIQNIEFEMLNVRPVMYKLLTRPFRRGVNILEDGVSTRFKEAIIELHKKRLLLDLALGVPRAHDLITRHDYTLEELEAKRRRTLGRKSSTTKSAQTYLSSSESKTSDKPLKVASTKSKTVKDTKKKSTTSKKNTTKSVKKTTKSK